MVTVSNHALLRWLERVEGIGVQGLRMRYGHDLTDHQMLPIVARELNQCLETVRHHLQALARSAAVRSGEVDIEGVRFCIHDGVLCTVTVDNEAPETRRKLRRRARRREHRHHVYKAGEAKFRYKKYWSEE